MAGCASYLLADERGRAFALTVADESVVAWDLWLRLDYLVEFGEHALAHIPARDRRRLRRRGQGFLAPRMFGLWANPDSVAGPGLAQHLDSLLEARSGTSGPPVDWRAVRDEIQGWATECSAAERTGRAWVAASEEFRSAVASGVTAAAADLSRREGVLSARAARLPSLDERTAARHDLEQERMLGSLDPPGRRGTEYLPGLLRCPDPEAGMTDYFDADEEAAVREYLADGGDRPEVRDDLHRRLLDAVAAGAPEAGPSLDTAVLVRHWLRRLSERDGAPYRARLAPGIETMVQPFRDRAGLSQRGGWWGATPFRPEWLDATIPVDQAVIAGTHKGRSAPTEEPARRPSIPPDHALAHLPLAGAARGRAGRAVGSRRRHPHHDDPDRIRQDRGRPVRGESVPGRHDDHRRPDASPGL